MKPDQSLSSLLGDWQPRVQADPGLEQRVWSRIGHLERRSDPMVGPWRSLFGWITLFARPRIALTAIVTALSSGILIGGLQARNDGEAAYLRSVDPLHLHPHSR